ncbi:1-deoxy-D-xylulose-5-phosphate reductoisomerase [Boudabousia liubingyangii]|uniref:1-deoxy-D-xylulose 5-phosphate reductoisomerase n=1 Tax=Boudabousia liubingyangii TaxID=1921764 RepID=A0A1Q5PKM4_9ACTO|nr:1-deoxy-D-xylulose-5-phosphate reductoisomerase [Boudabousia liubingyangii]OKL47187.1 1-deoxy-D-xylulose-5-phosphate reductoisomerase [Boudabousia liubingyangii]
MREVVLLGSTGSIGTQCLEVIENNPGKFRVTALSAGGNNLELLAAQAVAFQVPTIAIEQPRADELGDLIRLREQETGVAQLKRQIITGTKASAQAAATCSASGVVVNGINGGIGLSSTLSALDTGATLALANKESLVAGGPLVNAHQQYPGQIVPVDSEHSAIHQCLQSGLHERGLTMPVVTGRSEVRKLILTASGGPFRGKKRADLVDVSVEDALKHPTWAMGPVVTINSSTLMNKALELIEAHLLFDLDPEAIEPVIHPQSHIHSGVLWNDGSLLLQASPPSMLIPIALGLSWPERLSDVAPAEDFSEPFSWDFEPVDHEAFPALTLARQVAKQGGSAPAVMNAANEVAVQAFRDRKCGFLGIVDTVRQVCDEHQTVAITELQELLEVQTWAVKRAQQLLGLSA